MNVNQKQCLLAYLGYYTGAIDGIWDEIVYFKKKAPGIACPCGRCGGWEEVGA